MTSAPPLAETLCCPAAALAMANHHYFAPTVRQSQVCALAAWVAFVCALAIVSPKGHSSVCRRRQEGKILRVPSALNHFVFVLSHHHQRKLLREVPCGRGTEIIRNHSGIYIPALWGFGWFCLFAQ